MRLHLAQAALGALVLKGQTLALIECFGLCGGTENQLYAVIIKLIHQMHKAA